jgi:hypothetical protein
MRGTSQRCREAMIIMSGLAAAREGPSALVRDGG